MGHVLADSRNKHANERELRNAAVATDLYGIQLEKSPNLPKAPKAPGRTPNPKRVPPKAMLLTVAGG